MLLKLTSRVPVWHYGSIHFSLLDPGPKDIDVESLDEHSQRVIATAINSGILSAGDSCCDSVPNNSVDSNSLTKVSAIESKAQDKIKKAKDQLKGSAKSVIAWCKRNKNSYQVLSVMLEIEEKKQNRKSVVKAITEILESTGGVSTIVDNEDDGEEVIIKIG